MVTAHGPEPPELLWYTVGTKILTWSRSSDVGGKQTEKLEADDVDSCDQRV